MEKRAEKLFSIGETGKLCRLPISTIRYYDAKGIVKAAYVDKESDYRYYNWDSIFQLNLIRLLSHYGFTLNESREIAGGISNDPDFERTERAFREKLEEQENKLREINIYYESLKGWHELMHAAKRIWEMKEVPIEQIYFEEMDAVKVVPQNYQEKSLKSMLVNVDLVNEICAKNKNSEGQPSFVDSIGATFLVYPDREARLNLDFEKTVLYARANYLCGNHWVKFGGFPAITTYHRGRPGTIKATYDKIQEWAEEHSFRLGEQVIERYTIGYWTTLNEDIFITKIIIPLAE